MIEIRLIQKYEIHDVEVLSIPRIGERVKVNNYYNETIIDGIVTSVEYLYTPKYNTITVRVE